MIELGGRRYRLPARRTAVVCIDGCAPEYLELALADGLMPRLRGALDAGGTMARGRGQMPSFTNPNNLSIVTGLPPSGHGISGNFYFDPEVSPGGAEVAMNEPRFLRSATIFERLEQAGVRTLCVTAKDKLRALLGAVQDPRSPRPTSLSAERAHEQTVPELRGRSILDAVGKPNPGIYSPDVSHYAMEMALALHEPLGARVVYVSLTDYVQHKEPPRGPVSDRFLARLDELVGAFLDAGFVCGLTADHGMNDKTAADGSPDVRYLEDVLAAAGVAGSRVILPITDPYVVHHGALGSYATVYVGARGEGARGRGPRRGARRRGGAGPGRSRGALLAAGRSHRRSGGAGRSAHGAGQERGVSRSVGGAARAALARWAARAGGAHRGDPPAGVPAGGDGEQRGHLRPGAEPGRLRPSPVGGPRGFE